MESGAPPRRWTAAESDQSGVRRGPIHGTGQPGRLADFISCSAAAAAAAAAAAGTAAAPAASAAEEDQHWPQVAQLVLTALQPMGLGRRRKCQELVETEWTEMIIPVKPNETHSNPLNQVKTQ